MAETFVYQRKIGWADVDPAAIIFYPRYFEMFNATVEEWFDQALDYSYSQMSTVDQTGVPALSHHARYIEATRMGDVVDFHLWLTDIKRATFDVTIEGWCAGRKRVEVDMRLMFVTKEPLKAATIPDDLRAKMQRFLHAEATTAV